MECFFAVAGRKDRGWDVLPAPADFGGRDDSRPPKSCPSRTSKGRAQRYLEQAAGAFAFKLELVDIAVGAVLQYLFKRVPVIFAEGLALDRKSTRLNSSH